jgi:hypothetical protein
MTSITTLPKVVSTRTTTKRPAHALSRVRPITPPTHRTRVTGAGRIIMYRHVISIPPSPVWRHSSPLLETQLECRSLRPQIPLWARPYTNISSATSGIHNNVQRDSRRQQGKKSTLPHTTAPHTSWRIAGPITVKPMSWLPDIVTYVTPPSTDGHVSLLLFY